MSSAAVAIDALTSYLIWIYTTYPLSFEYSFHEIILLSAFYPYKYLPSKRQSQLQQMTFINIFSLFFRENKTWYFMWILCLAEDSHETSSLISLET